MTHKLITEENIRNLKRARWRGTRQTHYLRVWWKLTCEDWDCDFFNIANWSEYEAACKVYIGNCCRAGVEQVRVELLDRNAPYGHEPAFVRNTPKVRPMPRPYFQKAGF